MLLEGANRSQELKDLVVQTLQEVRKISQDLRPAHLDELGLEAALRQYCREIAERGKLEVNVLVHLPYEPTTSQEIVLYRITQEALTNVLRHAKAKNASVVLTGNEDTLQLVIEDNGIGFDPNGVPQGHLGLVGIRERVGLLGGTCHVESTLDKGT